VQIVGVSFDPYETNAGFHDLNEMQFELWTDDDPHTLATTYGAGDADSLYASRVTKLINENGDLVVEYVSAIDVGTHPALVLQDCRTIWEEQ
jgi:peroxiredoxin